MALAMMKTTPLPMALVMGLWLVFNKD